VIVQDATGAKVGYVRTWSDGGGTCFVVETGQLSSSVHTVLASQGGQKPDRSAVINAVMQVAVDLGCTISIAVTPPAFVHPLRLPMRSAFEPSLVGSG
jgi:hypothetical protein